MTALIAAARNGHTEIARILLAAGADITMKTDRGETARQIALQYKNTDIAELIDKRNN